MSKAYNLLFVRNPSGMEFIFHEHERDVVQAQLKDNPLMEGAKVFFVECLEMEREDVTDEYVE
jgi:hypothetical protein